MSDVEPITINNLKYVRHDTVRVSTLVSLAFVTVEDLGTQGKGFSPPHYKHYYGLFDGSDESIHNIMKTGNKFDYVDGRITL